MALDVAPRPRSGDQRNPILEHVYRPRYASRRNLRGSSASVNVSKNATIMISSATVPLASPNSWRNWFRIRNAGFSADVYVRESLYRGSYSHIFSIVVVDGPIHIP